MAGELDGLRVGCVSYLNARPLVWTLDGERIVFEVPALLADDFAAGRLDVALLPLFEVLRGGGGFIVDDVAIACEGPVHSVYVASQGSFAEAGKIYLDPSSRSSAALLRVLVAEYYADTISICEGVPPEGAARLIIGDPALEFRREHDFPWQFHDLGSLWQQETGLPFVFAVWALGAGVREKASVANCLRVAKESGLACRAEIAAKEDSPTEAMEYLTRSIRYEIGPMEKEAIALFARLAHEHGLVPEAVRVEYV